MKNVLFLDDDEWRTGAISDRLQAQPCRLVTVATAHECIALLESERFDLVLLDHDLGGETFVDSTREDCGMEVVRRLKASPQPHGAFIVHTMNPVAAAAMYLELSGLGYSVRQAPFGSSDFYAQVFRFLGLDDPTPGRRKPTLAERVQEYVRNVRRGR